MGSWVSHVEEADSGEGVENAYWVATGVCWVVGSVLAQGEGTSTVEKGTLAWVREAVVV